MPPFAIKKRILCIFAFVLLTMGILYGVYTVHERMLSRYDLRIWDCYVYDYGELPWERCALIALKGDIEANRKEIPTFRHRNNSVTIEHFWHTLQWYRSSGRQWLFHADTYLKGESLESFSRDPYPDYVCSDGEPMVSVFSGRMIPEGTYGTGRMLAGGIALIELKKDHFELLITNEILDDYDNIHIPATYNFYLLREDRSNVPFKDLKKEDFVFYRRVPTDPSPDVATTHVELPLGVYRIEKTYNTDFCFRYAHIKAVKKE